MPVFKFFSFHLLDHITTVYTHPFLEQKNRYSNLKEYSNIPGHDVIRHSADSCPKPAHGFPPLEGAGLSHVRLLYTLP